MTLELSSIYGMPIITSSHVPPGQFIIIDRRIYTNLTINQFMITLWVADAMKKGKTHLALLVAECEARLGLI